MTYTMLLGAVLLAIYGAVPCARAHAEIVTIPSGQDIGNWKVLIP